MSVDIRQSIKMAKTLSIIDPKQDKYTVFWLEFYGLLKPKNFGLDNDN